jgi:hypothetical protein
MPLEGQIKADAPAGAATRADNDAASNTEV